MTEAIRWVLSIEKNKKDRSGLYGYTQRSMAFNSNKIEGSTLTEDQTAALFEEGYLPATEEHYISKDIEEMNGHFLMFNRMLSFLGEELTEEIIKSLHYELKAGVFEDRANGYAIGEYKKWTNTVGGLTVVAPDKVSDEMGLLLSWYHSQSKIDLRVLAELHAKYELIHPFQDGNGRTGRIILFKECLDNDIIPFIIHNENRADYIISLKEAQTLGDCTNLESLFVREQEDYLKKCRDFSVDERYNNYSSKQECEEDTVKRGIGKGR